MWPQGWQPEGWVPVFYQKPQKNTEKYTSNINEVYYMPRMNELRYLLRIYIGYILVGYQGKICVAFPASNGVYGPL